MKIELKFKAPLYSNPDRKGNQRLIKRSVVYTVGTDTDLIKTVCEVYKQNGEIDKKRCRIFHENLENLIVEYPYEEMWRLKNNDRFTVKGFQYGQNRTRNKKSN